MAPSRALKSWLAPLTESRRRRPARTRRLGLESLESRVVPSTLPPPNPIDPTHGQSNLLRVVQKHADQQNLNAQDHAPVPYVVIASAGGADPTIKNWHAGAPTRIDADHDQNTGQGGKDIQVEVNTDLYTNAQGKPDWKLRLNVNRIGSAPFAQNLSVVIAFPWSAFDTNNETLPAQPNLLMGFQTQLPGTPGQANYVTGIDGGNAPATLEMVLTPHILAGTTHAFEWSVDTTGASNPLTFLSGEFDGDPGSNTIANALGWSAYVQDVPAHVGAEIKVTENAIGSPAVDSKMDLHWTASSPTLTAFDYVEAESKGTASSPQTADYATQVVADKMPTDERFVLRQDEAGGVMTLAHDGSAPIHEMTFQKTRRDGLALTGVASDDNPANDAVPTHVALTLGLRGYETLDVNANTLDLNLQDTQVGGFNNTGQFFQKYGLEYVALKVKNAPDQSANFDGATKTFTASATNAGESVPFTEMVLDDNGRIGATNAPLNLDLPSNYAVAPPWDLWSIVDDGARGTTVARALDAKTATYNHYAPDIKETVELQTVAAHPMQIYLRSGLLSAVQPPFGPSPDPYIEVTGHIENVPTDHTQVTLDFPLTAHWVTDHKIDEICMAGRIGLLNFATVLTGNPTEGGFDFRPEGSLVVTAISGGQPDFFTGNAAVAYDVTGFDPQVVLLPELYSQNGFHSQPKTFFPGTRLKEARLRLDHVPSMRATWDNDPNKHTYIDIDTDAASGPFAYVGGVQIQVSTKTTLAGTTLTCDNVFDYLPAAPTATSEHYALLKDVAGEQTLKFGVFGVDSLHFDSDDTSSPSKYTLDFQLDPSRPYTAAHINVDTHPTSTGALGTFFGGSEVTGPLDISYVPSHLNIQSDFDPGFCTDGTFPGTGLPPLPFPLPTPSDIDQHFTVDGTNIFVHAHDLAPKVCLYFDVTGSTSTLSLTSTDSTGTRVMKTGLVEILFQNTTAGLDQGALFGAPNPIHEARLRFDDVPSVDVSWSTGGANPFFDINTTAADDPSTPGVREDILGGYRMDADVTAHSPVLSTYTPLTGTENHSFSLLDDGSDKRFEGQLIGLDHFRVSVPGATNQVKVEYTGNVSRDLTVQVRSKGGKISQDYDIDAGLLISPMPQSFTLTANLNGQALSTDGNSGITKLRVGRSDVSTGSLPDGVFDKHNDPSNVAFAIDMTGLPAKFGFTVNPGQSGGATITAQTAGGSPSSVGSIDVRVQDDAGLGGAGLLGSQPVRDARLRLDSIPTMSANWSSGSGGTNVDVSTAAAGGPFRFLGGAQVILSTVRDTVPFTAPVGGEAQKVIYGDAGGNNKKSLALQLYGLDEFHLATTNSPRNTSITYAADTARQLIVGVDARFENKFFPDYDVNATLTVTSVPAAWTLGTDMATNFHSHASTGISSVSVVGTIDDTKDNNANGTAVNVQLTGLPKDVDFVLTPDSSATLTMNAPITLVSATLSSPNKIFGSKYQLIQAALHDIPAHWSADWSNGQFVIESKDASDNPSPMGLVTATVSTSSDGPTNAGKIMPFQTSGPNGARINYSPFLSTIDSRFYNSAPGGGPGALAALDALYNHASVLGADEDHAVIRTAGGGSLDFLDARFTGFQKVAYQPNDNGGHFEFSAPVAGQHEFLAGANKGDQFLVAHIDNIPDHATLDIDLNAHDVHFHTSDDTGATAGTVDVYYGPAGMAQDGQKALRAVMQNTPDDVHIFWGFGDNSGSANFVSSRLFTVLFLNQDSGNRITAAARLRELQAGYNVNFDPHFDPHFDLLFVPTGLDLIVLDAKAGIDNSVDFDEDGHPIIGADPMKDPVSGFFTYYSMKNNPDSLTDGAGNPVGPAPAGSEYVPTLSVLMKDFKEFSLGLTIGVHVFGFDGFLTPFIDPSVHFDGAFDLDFWAGKVDITTPVPVLGDFGLFNAPDYTDNTPIHLVPTGGISFPHLHDAVYTFAGFHGFGDHFDPLPPMLAVAPPTTVTTDPALGDDVLLPLWQEAARRWAAAGANPAQVARALATPPTVGDLPGLFLGTTSGSHVTIDSNAAGYGWFVDPTPATDEEFGPTGNGAAAGRMDLLTVLSHEMGRLLGYDVADAGAHAVMSLALTPGTRLGDGPAGDAGHVVSDAVKPTPAAPAILVAPVAAGPVVTSLLAFAPELGGPAPGTAEPSASVALLDPEKQQAALGDVPVAAAPPATTGGGLAPSARRPADDAAEDDFAPVCVG